jgi:hypothetical protein
MAWPAPVLYGQFRVETCGLTAGTSTLDSTVAEVEAALQTLVPGTASEPGSTPATSPRCAEERPTIGAA